MSTPKTVPDLFQQTRQEWLDECRAVARELLKVRQSITIEDVLAKCPRPRYLHRNATGSVFFHDDFVAVGYTSAKKASSNGRVIRLWSLR